MSFSLPHIQKSADSRAFSLDFMDLTVIGGSSVGTPVLLKELNTAVANGELPETHVRLFGRNQLRLERILSYFRSQTVTASVSVSIHQDVKSALTDATHVLCQIRPGGMESRAKAERAALAAGIPGDEGLGPGGLAAFLIGRPAIKDVINQCARYAPNALFMQMSSPLGLFVALAGRVLHRPAYGICELPNTTVGKVLNLMQSHTGLENLTYSLAGLNHQSWLYDFRDTENNDRTRDVLDAIDDPKLVGIEPDMIREMGAVPVPYLKLFIHGGRELARQLGQPNTRGEELTAWRNKLDHAYCDDLQPDLDRISALLGRRDMGWYKHGVVPALQKFVSRDDQTFPLNLANHGAIPGIDDTAIVEVLCKVGNGVAKPIKTTALPDRPAQLTRSLVAYEQKSLDLPERPTVRRLEDVLALHPMVPRQNIRATATQVRAVALALP